MLRKPEWLKSNKVGSKKAQTMTKFLRQYNLSSVCESAKCPNKGECFEKGTATFLILGDICTRNCSFCAVNKETKNLQHPDPLEPESIAILTKELALRHVVVTTVTRDDLSDGGASHFAEVVLEIRRHSPETTIELLISDLNGNWKALESILVTHPDILNHNVETVQRLYPEIRPKANYQQSLELLKKVKAFDPHMITKSGIMVGLGETEHEVFCLMDDLIAAGVNIMTIGQYMQPSRNHYSVKEYIKPETFELYKIIGGEKGFNLVESGPLIRSSYHAENAKNIFNFSAHNEKHQKHDKTMPI